jgi:hypothetical protein
LGRNRIFIHEGGRITGESWLVHLAERIGGEASQVRLAAWGCLGRVGRTATRVTVLRRLEYPAPPGV